MTSPHEVREPSVRIYEVGPRDGLQNEETFIATEQKVALVKALLDAGLSRVEASSFVHPRWIPALADADELFRQLHGVDGADRLTALVPNARGLTRAAQTELQEVALFMSASETHNRRNINKSHKETWSVFEPLFTECTARGLRVRAYLSTCWGCPYEGMVDPVVVARLTERLCALGAYEVSLGDTIGIGDPALTRRLLDEVDAAVSLDRIAMHMHDTWGRALANCIVGLERGVRTFDASIGGLGGCPYAPGASGNLATEDLVATLQAMGVDCGVSWEKLLEAGRLAQSFFETSLPSRALRAALSRCE